MQISKDAKNLELIYIANARMPTERAHGWQIVKMCEAFANAGREVTLVVPKRWRNSQTADLYSFYGVKRNFKVVYLPCIDFLSFVSGDFLSSLTFKIQAASFALGVLICFGWRPAQFFSRDHFSAFLLALFGRKVILEIHDQPSASRPMHWLMQRLGGLVTTNRWKGDKTAEAFQFPRNRMLLAYNAVDTEQFILGQNAAECRRTLGLPNNKKLVIYAGHLYPWKGVFTLAEVARYLPEYIEIIFVGGTKTDIAKFKNFVDQNLGAASSRIKIVGHRPHTEIPAYLCAADALVVPTSAKENIGLRETSPLKLFEAMAARRPVVVSQTPSALEVVRDREVIFFEPDNAKDLADKIMVCLNERAGNEERVKNAWEKVQSLSWDNRAKKIVDFMNQS